MIFLKSTLAALLVAIVSTASTADAAGNLRRSAVRRLGPSIECTIQVHALLRLDPTGDEDEDIFDCELDAYETGGIASQIFPLGIDKDQKKELKELLKAGVIEPNHSRLDVGGGVWDGLEIKVPPGQLKDKVKKGKGKKFEEERRRLFSHVGEKPSKSTFVLLLLLLFHDIISLTGSSFLCLCTVLFVKVIDNDGKTYPHSPSEMGDNVFGTEGDPVNLKSQMAACSFGKLNIEAGDPNTPLPSAIEPAPGVIEVTIDVSSSQFFPSWLAPCQCNISYFVLLADLH